MGGPALIDDTYYPEFDNFYECEIRYEGHIYKSSEHLFQAFKNTDPNYRKAIRACLTPFDAWRLGQKCFLRHDWEVAKYGCMFYANHSKFKQNPDLLQTLLGTTGNVIYHGSIPYWNQHNAVILEELRRILKAEVK